MADTTVRACRSLKISQIQASTELCDSLQSPEVWERLVENWDFSGARANLAWMLFQKQHGDGGGHDGTGLLLIEKLPDSGYLLNYVILYKVPRFGNVWWRTGILLAPAQIWHGCFFKNNTVTMADTTVRACRSLESSQIPAIY
jgi:hypothetical protein